MPPPPGSLLSLPSPSTSPPNTGYLTIFMRVSYLWASDDVDPSSLFSRMPRPGLWELAGLQRLAEGSWGFFILKDSLGLFGRSLGNSHDLWKGLDQGGLLHSQNQFGDSTPEPRTLDSTEGKLIFLLSVPPAGRTFPGRASPEEEGQGPLGSKTRALALSSPEWIFMKDVDHATLLFCSWEGGSEPALHLLPSIPLKELEPVFAEEVAFPPGGQTQLPMQPEFFSDRVFSQIFVFPRSRARKAQALLTSPAEPLAAKLPCSLDWNSLPHPPWLSAPFSGTGSLITAPWSGDSLQRTEPKHSWGSSRCVISLRSSVSRAPLPDRNRPALLINTCQQCPNLELGGGVLTYFSIFIITWLCTCPSSPYLESSPRDQKTKKPKPLSCLTR